ncbi:protein FAM200C-like [Clavelina lepadiformis]|uniref:protein FAM200C-like n=1 Tax=Clavelina lepadiformis TaxID=159417 RepID=UPI0040417456
MFASKYPAGDGRKKACIELLSGVQVRQQQLRAWVQHGDCNSASFAGSLAIVRNGKPFTDGEYAAYYSLALDESTDVSHLSQFSVIARYVTGDIVREESLTVLPMKGKTRGEDLIRSFLEFAKEKNLPLDELISVCTDGAPCMMGKHKGFVALLREHENRPILSYHCILHQEALCAQTCGKHFGEVMGFGGQLHCCPSFKALLDEVGNNYPGLLLHSNVRWLSRGKAVLQIA